MKKVILRIDHLKKSFGKKDVIKDFDLDVYEGEFLTLLGSSGCGKTTILRAIAGLDPVSDGHIYIDDKDVTDLDPKYREVNTIFQNYALFPLMTVEENIGFGLKMKKVDKETIKKRVQEMLELVHLEGYEKRKPKELSGGEQQRIAIARALANDPSFILADEPTGNLDVENEKIVYETLRNLADSGKSVIVVSHNEILKDFSDEVYEFSEGKIIGDNK